MPDFNEADAGVFGPAELSVLAEALERIWDALKFAVDPDDLEIVSELRSQIAIKVLALAKERPLTVKALVHATLQSLPPFSAFWNDEYPFNVRLKLNTERARRFHRAVRAGADNDYRRCRQELHQRMLKTEALIGSSERLISESRVLLAQV